MYASRTSRSTSCGSSTTPSASTLTRPAAARWWTTCRAGRARRPTSCPRTTPSSRPSSPPPSSVEKLFRVVIKEIKGSQYGVQLESSVRDRLVAVDKYDDDEEAALEKLTDFFQPKYFKPNSVITFHFPTTPGTAEISFAMEGKDEAKICVENENVAGMIQKWYLGGASAVSTTTVRSLTEIDRVFDGRTRLSVLS
ncbi:hypothetical protein PVAP13_4KG345500 [Panicum virgatum]|uniref:Chalcone-flavonone isomerase family protein n=1 Tax=Panicum virgatum TaxID=38727 RepID=A0A8T0TZ68_PANVG|nr:hypothetical protein PVAP13_4KG345500 [Panicum virgatum]